MDGTSTTTQSAPCFSRFLQYLRSRGSSLSFNFNDIIKDVIFAESDPFIHAKDLHGHFGCVNCFDFNSTFDLLVSSGDDRRILIWPILSTNVPNPVSTVAGCSRRHHHSNVFDVKFSRNDSTKLASCANDGYVNVYDTERPNDVLDTFEHGSISAVFKVCFDHGQASNNCIYSASSDGTVRLWDCRSHGEVLRIVSDDVSSFSSVDVNPSQPSHVLVSGGGDSAVLLYDIRSNSSVQLRTYDTPEDCPEVSSAIFDASGRRFITSCLGGYPSLYDTEGEENPLVVFKSPGFSNLSTVKSASFAVNDEFVVAGSDDFRIYLWAIPDMDTTPAADDDETLVVHDSLTRLSGHRSVVNNVRWNEQGKFLVSAGPEKILKIWTMFPMWDSHPTSLSTTTTADDTAAGTAASILDYIRYLISDRREGDESDPENALTEDEETIRLFEFITRHDRNMMNEMDEDTDEDDEDEEDENE